MPRERLEDDEVAVKSPLAMEPGDEELPEEDDEIEDNYFSHQKSNLDFVPSGAAVLDCTIGGGWPLTRISNVVGDASTGKTLLAIEALSNFKKKWPNGKAFYREAESAFDEPYAEALGLPVKEIDFINPEQFMTVEDFYDDLMDCCRICKKTGEPGFYIEDSLDALSDKAEMEEKDFSKGTYGTGKAKQMSKMFRLVRKEIADANMHLMIVSQTRDKINSQFPQKTRAGGMALNFYASQILWLSHMGGIDKIRNKVSREVGIKVLAKCTKNKIALPHRQCGFSIRFGMGVDNLESSIQFLDSVGELEDIVGVKKETYNTRVGKMSDSEYWNETDRLDREVRRVWVEVEDRFMREVRQRRR